MSELLQAWSSLLPAIQARQSFALLSHVRPDGDAYGSSLALGLALEALGKKVFYYNQDGLNPRYGFLPGSEMIQKTALQNPGVDAVISLDNASQPRLGNLFQDWKTPVWLNIDHHISNERFGEHNFIDATAPATGQVLFELFQAAGWPLTPAMADNLFVAISTDTGSFKYRNTTTRTFEVAAALSQAGARVAEMSEACYGNYPLARTKLLRAILQELKFECGERLAYYPITQSMYQATGATPEDTEGLIETIISNEGVELAICFEERGPESVKMSFRSKGKVNCTELAALFGGGGHKEASGAQLNSSLNDVVWQVLELAKSKLSN